MKTLSQNTSIVSLLVLWHGSSLTLGIHFLPSCYDDLVLITIGIKRWIHHADVTSMRLRFQLRYILIVYLLEMLWRPRIGVGHPCHLGPPHISVFRLQLLIELDTGYSGLTVLFLFVSLLDCFFDHFVGVNYVFHKWSSSVDTLLGPEAQRPVQSWPCCQLVSLVGRELLVQGEHIIYCVVP